MRSRDGVRGFRLARTYSASRTGDQDLRDHYLRVLRSDLHDSVGPLLSAVAMRTEAARAIIIRDPEAAREMLGELHADACHALAEVRRLARTEPVLNSPGSSLAMALQRQADRFSQASGGRLTVRLTVAPGMAVARDAIRTAVYRIASEALTNTARHAMATSCTIRAWADEEDFHVEITDDGVGIPSRSSQGFGLTSMRERARTLGGTCVVENVVPHGTRVYATLPADPRPHRQRREA